MSAGIGLAGPRAAMEVGWWQNGPCGHRCISLVLHQVELLEGLLNYYILSTLYPKVNGKNHYGSFQIEEDSALCGEKSWTWRWETGLSCRLCDLGLVISPL